MTPSFKLQRALSAHPNHLLDRGLYLFSMYAVPVFLALISLFTVLAWESSYSAPDARQIEFRAMVDANPALTPEQAGRQLESQPISRHFDTRLSESPVWFSVALPADGTHAPATLDFPSRHSMSVDCWDAKTQELLGHADRNATTGAMQPVKSGFAMTLASAGSAAMVCRSTFVGPARLSVLQWPATQLQNSSEEFHRTSGLLDGGLIVLALFVLIAAAINRDSTYVLFAAWLVLNLRMAALSGGWDTQWLGHDLPAQWMLEIRALTMATYYMLTVTLFRTLFRDDLARTGSTRLLQMVQWTTVPLFVVALTCPYRWFLPCMWGLTGINSAVLIVLLGRILRRTRSPVAMWYSASIAVTLMSSLYEVISAALGYKGLIGAVNSVTAALSSSLLAALAIAEQMRVEHRQRLEAQAELKHTFNAMPIGLFSLDVRGHFLSANPALLTMLDSNVMTAGRSSWAQYFQAGSWEQLYDLVQNQVEGELELRGNRTLVPGLPQTFLVRATLARGKIEGSLQDVTERTKATEDLRFMANNDPLTKVFNRRGIEQVLDAALAELDEGKPLALAYLDLDRFKLLNDLYGHATGDEVLKQVCERVAGMLTGGQHIGRVGGDEFVIVLPNTAIPLASWICRGIVNSISTTSFRIGDKAFQVRGSIGLIEVSPGTPIRDAMATADRACHAAKTGHTDSLVVYEKNATAFHEREAELNLVERLSNGQAPEGLFVEMQPIMSLRAPHESLNFEVLLRMRDHDGTLIPTYRVINAAEASGRISVIDRWVMSTTLAWLDTNQDTLGNTQFVCMNLSGASLNDERFVQDAFVMLAKNLRAASRLCIEITESVALHDLHNTRRFIEKVRGYGVKVALDDFGAGYTSFSYLRELPADILKIDGSFIVDMNKHPANIAIVEAIVSLAMNLGMKTIAEWAEDNATVQTLAEIGVDYVQGFVVARPQAPSRILTAASSAGFIQEAELARFVGSLGTAGSNASAVDRLEAFRFGDMH